MTRTFNEKIRCPDCGYIHTVETDFERWMRGHAELKSQDGIVRFDLDVLLHRYKFIQDGKGVRDIQCLMFVEVKTHMAKPSQSQIDTLSMLNQVLRNRKSNINSNHRPQVTNQPDRVRSQLLKRDVTLRMYGGHLLQLDKTSPDNSGKMLWDYKEITPSQLIGLLRFELNPDGPHLKLDHRRRSTNWTESPQLPFTYE